MEKGLEKIFIGTDIEANYIAAMLNEESIPCFVHNNLISSQNAGWVDGNSDQSTVLLVYAEDVDKAKAVVDSYLNNK